MRQNFKNTSISQNETTQHSWQCIEENSRKMSKMNSCAMMQLLTFLRNSLKLWSISMTNCMNELWKNAIKIQEEKSIFTLNHQTNIAKEEILANKLRYLILKKSSQWNWTSFHEAKEKTLKKNKEKEKIVIHVASWVTSQKIVDRKI